MCNDRRMKWNKKGDATWVSAVLYFGLSIVVLSIILGAGMPVVNKLKDKNIAIQTKEVMFSLDNNIREVARGGPGTQRVITLNLKKGEFKVTQSSIKWQYKSKALLSEVGVEINEGTIKLRTDLDETEKGKYDITIWLQYDSILLETSGLTTITGTTQLIIRNEGADPDQRKIKVKLMEK